MSDSITNVHAMEILDSRGNPTIRVFCTLSSGVIAHVTEEHWNVREIKSHLALA